MLASANVDDHFYRQVFPSFHAVTPIIILDSIDGADSVNTQILLVKDKLKKNIGFIRDIKTSTGCQSACLPVIFTLFYNQEFKFLKILSKEGLTKKNHEPFSPEDYWQLEALLIKSPAELEKIKTPHEMVDVLTSATKVELKPFVVSAAAYSTLRIFKYHQETMRVLSTLSF